MAEISPDVLKNTVVSLNVPLTVDELDAIEWRAKAMRAALLDLPAPIRPGLWARIKRFALKVYATWLDRKAYVQMISEQSYRICVLEDCLQANGMPIPGGRSDE